MRYYLLLLLLPNFGSPKIEDTENLYRKIITNLPISLDCYQQFQRLLKNLKAEESWALEMLNAASKLPMGLVPLEFKDMGKFDQCINLEVMGDLYGKYCIGKILRNNISLPSSIWALCVPNQCSTFDATIFGNSLMEYLFPEEDITLTFSSLSCQTKKDVFPKLTTSAIFTIAGASLILFFIIVSTLFDLYFTFYHPTEYTPIVFEIYSLYTNGKSIFKKRKENPEHLPCLDGLKFISMLWVLLFHQYLVPLDGFISNMDDVNHWVKKIHRMFIISGSLSVDTFLTISGTLMCYNFMRARHKARKFNIFRYYIHRYLRFTGSLAVVVLVSGTLLKYLGSGPQWPVFVSTFQANCEHNWWSTILYVQNYVNPSTMCVGETWYINVDMQLFLFSPIIYFLLEKHPRITFCLLGIISTCSMLSSFYVAWTFKLPALEFSLYSPQRKEYETQYYLPTHTRLTPWIVGTILGYTIAQMRKNQKRLRLNKFLVLGLWVMAKMILFSCVLGPFDVFINNQYEQVPNAIYIAFARPVWSLAIAWIIFACLNNYGGVINWFLSFSIYQFFNRFVYSMYITSVTLMYGITLSRRQPDYFTEFDRIYQFWGSVCFLGILAVFLVLMVEAPLNKIEKIIAEEE